MPSAKQELGSAQVTESMAALEPGLGFGVTDHVDPFQRSIRGLLGPECAPLLPTAKQLVADVQDTDRNPLSGPTLGLATSDHEPPLHCSTTGTSAKTPATRAPTAKQASAAGHDTPQSVVIGVWAETDQDVPSHCSMTEEPPPPVNPTAKHAVAETHETDSRVRLLTAGEEEIDQAEPSHRSIRGPRLLGVVVCPTAMQNVVLVHEAPFKDCDAGGGRGLGLDTMVQLGGWVAAAGAAGTRAKLIKTRAPVLMSRRVQGRVVTAHLHLRSPDRRRC